MTRVCHYSSNGRLLQLTGSTMSGFWVEGTQGRVCRLLGCLMNVCVITHGSREHFGCKAAAAAGAWAEGQALTTAWMPAATASLPASLSADGFSAGFNPCRDTRNSPFPAHACVHEFLFEGWAVCWMPACVRALQFSVTTQGISERGSRGGSVVAFIQDFLSWFSLLTCWCVALTEHAGCDCLGLAP